MAKAEKPPTIQETPDVNPQLAFEAAWDKNVDNMREVLTRTAQPRTGLRPSQIEKAGKIRASYGV